MGNNNHIKDEKIEYIMDNLNLIEIAKLLYKSYEYKKMNSYICINLDSNNPNIFCYGSYEDIKLPFNYIELFKIDKDYELVNIKKLAKEELNEEDYLEFERLRCKLGYTDRLAIEEIDFILFRNASVVSICNLLEMF
jgi:hypothetical protein